MCLKNNNLPRKCRKEVNIIEFPENKKNYLPGVNFINILSARFWYESKFSKFYLITAL